MQHTYLKMTTRKHKELPLEASKNFMPEKVCLNVCRHKFCDIDHDFGEFGIYEVLVNDDASVPNCRVDVVLEPVNIYLRKFFFLLQPF